MTTVETEHAEGVIHQKARRDWFQIVTLIVLVVALCWVALLTSHLARKAQTATANAQTLAVQIQRACASGAVMVADENVCDRAAAVVAEPQVPVAGQKGDQGQPGINGSDSFVPGPIGATGPFGKDGANGLDGTPGLGGTNGVAGLAGENGLDGTDGTNGTNGLDGPAGAPGGTGAPGAPGRGITAVACVDQGSRATPVWNWVFTFTDGTTQDIAGPCKVITAP